jgi:hypothetical protein
MNKHNDLLSFLSVVQHFNFDFLELKWTDGMAPLGNGANAEVRELFIMDKLELAFKRHRALMPQSSPGRNYNGHEQCSTQSREERIFNEMVAEVTILGHPVVQHHQNFVKLRAVYWELLPGVTQPWPVLVLEKADIGNLWFFGSSLEGLQMSIEQRLTICLDIGSAVSVLHDNGKNYALEN